MNCIMFNYENIMSLLGELFLYLKFDFTLHHSNIALQGVRLIQIFQILS